jgi:hypothetical protein
MEKNLRGNVAIHSDNTRITTTLILNCFILLAGRSIQHLFKDVPIRSLLWDQRLMEDIVRAIGIPWGEFVGSITWDNRINFLVHTVGLFYFLCSILCLYILIKGPAKIERQYRVFVVVAVALFLLSLLYFKEGFYRIGELMELTAQWMSPLIVYFAINDGINEKLKLLIRIAIALTFTGHGLFAVGFYPIPGNFVDMLIMSTGVTQNTAEQVLFVAGCLDFLISILIFFPRTYRYAAFYAFVWGFITAAARIWANFDAQFTADSLFQWIPEMMVRIPNALLPLTLFFISVISPRLVGRSKTNS